MARKKIVETTATPETATDTTVVAFTPADLAARYIGVQAFSDKYTAAHKWEWARDVSAMLACTADKQTRTAKSEELGAIIGQELRGKPYSGVWVRMWTSAYKKFESGISTPEEFRAFLAAGQGNAAKNAPPKETEPKAEPAEGEESGGADAGMRDYINEARKAIKRALSAGITAEEIRAGIDDLI